MAESPLRSPFDEEEPLTSPLPSRSPLRAPVEAGPMSPAGGYRLDSIGRSALAKGITSGLQQVEAGEFARLATEREARGDRLGALGARLAMEDSLLRADAASTGAPRSSAEVTGVGSALGYAANLAGSQAPIIARTLAGGAAGAAVGSLVAPGPGTVIGAGLGGAAASYVPLRDEMALSQQTDETIRQTPVEERLAAQRNYASQAAALEGALGLVPFGPMTRLGRAAAQARRGQRIRAEGYLRNDARMTDAGQKLMDEAAVNGPKTLVGQAAVTVENMGVGALVEGGTEGAQTLLQQAMLSDLDPSRDTSGDREELFEAILAGGTLGAGFIGATQVGDLLTDVARRRMTERRGDARQELAEMGVEDAPLLSRTNAERMLARINRAGEQQQEAVERVRALVEQYKPPQLIQTGDPRAARIAQYLTELTPEYANLRGGAPQQVLDLHAEIANNLVRMQEGDTEAQTAADRFISQMDMNSEQKVELRAMLSGREPRMRTEQERVFEELTQRAGRGEDIQAEYDAMTPEWQRDLLGWLRDREAATASEAEAEGIETAEDTTINLAEEQVVDTPEMDTSGEEGSDPTRQSRSRTAMRNQFRMEDLILNDLEDARRSSPTEALARQRVRELIESGAIEDVDLDTYERAPLGAVRDLTRADDIGEILDMLSRGRRPARERRANKQREVARKTGTRRPGEQSNAPGLLEDIRDDNTRGSINKFLQENNLPAKDFRDFVENIRDTYARDDISSRLKALRADEGDMTPLQRKYRTEAYQLALDLGLQDYYDRRANVIENAVAGDVAPSIERTRFGEALSGRLSGLTDEQFQSLLPAQDTAERAPIQPGQFAPPPPTLPERSTARRRTAPFSREVRQVGTASRLAQGRSGASYTPQKDAASAVWDLVPDDGGPPTQLEAPPAQEGVATYPPAPLPETGHIGQLATWLMDRPAELKRALELAGNNTSTVNRLLQEQANLPPTPAPLSTNSRERLRRVLSQIDVIVPTKRAVEMPADPQYLNEAQKASTQLSAAQNRLRQLEQEGGGTEQTRRQKKIINEISDDLQKNGIVFDVEGQDQPVVLRARDILGAEYDVGSDETMTSQQLLVRGIGRLSRRPGWSLAGNGANERIIRFKAARNQKEQRFDLRSVIGPDSDRAADISARREQWQRSLQPTWEALQGMAPDAKAFAEKFPLEAYDSDSPEIGKTRLQRAKNLQRWMTDQGVPIEESAPLIRQLTQFAPEEATLTPAQAEGIAWAALTDMTDDAKRQGSEPQDIYTESERRDLVKGWVADPENGYTYVKASNPLGPRRLTADGKLIAESMEAAADDFRDSEWQGLETMDPADELRTVSPNISKYDRPEDVERRRTSIASTAVSSRYTDITPKLADTFTDPESGEFAKRNGPEILKEVREEYKNANLNPEEIRAEVRRRLQMQNEPMPESFRPAFNLDEGIADIAPRQATLSSKEFPSGVTSYAGIGNRKAPPWAAAMAEQIAKRLGGEGALLRSGAAKGMDTAFERGAKTKEIFPAKGEIPQWAYDTVDEYHPYAKNLSDYARKAQARNAMILLGKDGESPVEVVIAYESSGATKAGPTESGGTTHAMRLAEQYGIPVINIADPETRSNFKQALGEAAPTKGNRYPMKFKMPADENIWGRDTTTIDEIIAGNRTSTTRGNWGKKGLPKTGDTVTFYGDGKTVDVVITDVTQITPQLNRNAKWREEWSEKEGWKLPDTRTLKGYQVEFRLADTEAGPQKATPAAAPTEKNKQVTKYARKASRPSFAATMSDGSVRDVPLFATIELYGMTFGVHRRMKREGGFYAKGYHVSETRTGLKMQVPEFSSVDKALTGVETAVDTNPTGVQQRVAETLAAQNKDLPKPPIAPVETGGRDMGQRGETPTQPVSRRAPKPGVFTMKRIKRKHLQDHPDVLFVFGDNMAGKGLGGQAKEMRGEPNAVGIPTKWKPSMSEDAFFDDAQLAEGDVREAIDSAFVKLRQHLEQGGTVVFPEDGVGTGMAQLEKRAPELHAYIESLVEGLKIYAQVTPALQSITTGTKKAAAQKAAQHADSQLVNAERALAGTAAPVLAPEITAREIAKLAEEQEASAQMIFGELAKALKDLELATTQHDQYLAEAATGDQTAVDRLRRAKDLAQAAANAEAAKEARVISGMKAAGNLAQAAQLEIAQLSEPTVTNENTESPTTAALQMRLARHAKNLREKDKRRRKAAETRRKAILDNLENLFPEIQLEVEQFFGARTTGKTKDFVSTIRLAAQNNHDDLSVGYHEALHQWMNRLRAGTPAARRMYRTLMKADQSEAFRKQVYSKLLQMGETDPQGTLRRQLEQPGETIAYGFQLYQMNVMPLKIPRDARTTFEKIGELLMRIVRMVSAHEQAETILAALSNGELAQRGAYAKFVKEHRIGNLRDRMIDLTPGFAKFHHTVMSSPITRIHMMGIPETDELADAFHVVPTTGRQATLANGEKVSIGYLTARSAAHAKFVNKAEELLDRLGDEDKAAIMRELYLENPSTNETVQEVRGLLGEVYNYLIDAGVKRPKYTLKPEHKGKSEAEIAALGRDAFDVEWVKFEKRKHYFVRSWRKDLTDEEVADLTDLLVEHGIDHGEQPMTRERAEQIATKFVRAENQPTFDNFHALHSSTLARELDFINDSNIDDFMPYLQQDLSQTLSSYLYQAATRGEYTRYFGNEGERITNTLDSLQESGRMTAAERATFERERSAMEGTMRPDFPEWAHKWTNRILTYQNLRVLELAAFSMMIDPLGAAIRTNSLSNAWQVYKGAFKMGDKKLRAHREMMARSIGLIERNSHIFAQASMHSGIETSQTTERLNRGFFRLTGIEALNTNMRVMMQGVAEQFIQSLPTYPVAKDGKRYMDELGLSQTLIKKMKWSDARQAFDIETDVHGNFTHYKGLTPQESARVEQAIVKVTDESLLRPNPATRPSWTSDPRFALIAHLKSFVFTYYEVILKRVFNEARHGNEMPLVAIASTVPVMIAVDFAKSTLMNLTDDDDEGYTLEDAMHSTFVRTGMLGKAVFPFEAVVDTANGYNPITNMMGPTVDQGWDLVKLLAGNPSSTVRRNLIAGVPGGNVVEPLFLIGEDE